MTHGIFKNVISLLCVPASKVNRHEFSFKKEHSAKPFSKIGQFMPTVLQTGLYIERLKAYDK